MLPQLTELKGAALNFFFPRFCVGCGKEGNFICSACQAELKNIQPPLCHKCGRPMVNSSVSRLTPQPLCDACTGWQTEIDGIRSVFRFESVIRKAIHEFKYNNLRAIAGGLAKLMGNYLIENHVPGEIMVPVPLHEKRLKERGYNQSALLAKELSTFTRLPVNDDCLIRNRYNLPQAKTKNVEERRQNVIGIFNCINDDLLDKRVLLIDDVTTSGATLNACASALKKAGAKSVWGLTLARES